MPGATEAVGDARWDAAQRAERGYWSGVQATHVAHGIQEQVAAAAWLSERVRDTAAGPWVEIGIGPLGVGVTHFLEPHPESVTGIDPLPQIDLDDRLPPALAALVATCRASYQHVVAQGESTGLTPASFAGGACYNVLDHVQDCGGVLDELHRLVRPGGPVLVACDTRSWLGAAKYAGWTRRRQAGSILVDAHPHQFTVGSLVRLVAAHGFTVRDTSAVSLGERIAGHGQRVFVFAERTP